MASIELIDILYKWLKENYEPECGWNLQKNYIDGLDIQFRIEPDYPTQVYVDLWADGHRAEVLNAVDPNFFNELKTVISRELRIRKSFIREQ
jgi:hypothetical protein